MRATCTVDLRKLYISKIYLTYIKPTNLLIGYLFLRLSRSSKIIMQIMRLYTCTYTFYIDTVTPATNQGDSSANFGIGVSQFSFRSSWKDRHALRICLAVKKLAKCFFVESCGLGVSQFSFRSSYGFFLLSKEFAKMIFFVSYSLKAQSHWR